MRCICRGQKESDSGDGLAPELAYFGKGGGLRTTHSDDSNGGDGNE